MRVLVNGLSARYLSGHHVLLGHLKQLAEWTQNEHEFIVLHCPDQVQLVQDLGPNVSWMSVSQRIAHWAMRTAWETFLMPGFLRKWNIDLIFTPAGTITPWCQVPQISLAQNPWCLVPIMLRTWRDRPKAFIQRRAYAYAARNAALMVYNSHYVQDLYRKNAGGAVEKQSEVVYQAIDHEIHQTAKSLCEQFPRQELLIVSISAMAAWKGTHYLVQAIAELHRRNLQAKLRLVGPWPDAHYEQFVRSEISRLNLTDWVTIHGRVSRADLLRNYAEGKVYCLMSECESFGIPAVEAQAFGTPVVGSNTCAMPEIGGNGGMFGSPVDIQNTADMLENLLTNQQNWEKYSLLASQNAARFKWSVCSQPLMKMFTLT